jgi:hypothetical protein
LKTLKFFEFDDVLTVSITTANVEQQFNDTISLSQAKKDPLELQFFIDDFKELANDLGCTVEFDNTAKDFLKEVAGDSYESFM